MVNPSQKRKYCDNFYTGSSFTITFNKETFLQDFLVSLNRMKALSTCFLGTTCETISVAVPNIQAQHWCSTRRLRQHWCKKIHDTTKPEIQKF